MNQTPIQNKKSIDFINFGHINIRSLKPKRIELVKFLNDYKIDIFSINESFLKPRDNFLLDDYNIVRNDRNICVL